MSIVDELKAAIAQAVENARWFDHGSPDESAGDRFLRDHGQALLEAVDRPDGVVISMELAQFLIGAEPLEEKWFGEPNWKGWSFWWRGDIKKAIDFARTKASAGGGA